MRGRHVRHARIGLALALFTTLALVEGAAAGGPGNRIAFTRLSDAGAQVFTANPDGSGERLVPLQDPVEDFGVPIWSRDHSRLLISHTIRFDGNGELLPFRPAIVRPDGSDYRLLQMPDAPFDTDCTSWSQNGARLYCAYGGDHPGLFSVRTSDGGDARRLTTNPYGTMDLAVDVSPDGSQILMLREQPGPPPDPQENETFALYVLNTDGSHFRLLVPYGITQGDEIGSAHWSPDGRSIIASSIDGRLFTVDPSGRCLQYLKLGIDGFAFMPNWSPDGSRIVFGLFGPDKEDLYTADANGRHVRQMTDTDAFEHGPDWR